MTLTSDIKTAPLISGSRTVTKGKLVTYNGGLDPLVANDFNFI